MKDYFVQGFNIIKHMKIISLKDYTITIFFYESLYNEEDPRRLKYETTRSFLK